MRPPFATLLAGVLLAAAPAGSETSSVWLDVQAPQRVEGPVALVELRGQAGVGAEGRYDLVLCIDTSHSTAFASGVDVDGDGRVGRALRSANDPQRRYNWNPRRFSTDSDDTRLAAERVAAQRLIQRLNLSRTRVGLVRFDSRAEIIAELGSSQEELTAALDGLGDHVFAGGTTEPATALRAAEAMLSAAPPVAGDVPRRFIVLLSDGELTRGADAYDEILAAADAAARVQARIEAFLWGEGSERDDALFDELATRTEGAVQRLARPADVMVALPQIRLSRVRAVSITNATGGAPARALRRFPDGSFDGIVPLQPGLNRLVVDALGPQDGAARWERQVEYVPSTKPDPSGEATLERLRRRTLETELAVRARERSRSTQGQALELEAAPPGAAPETPDSSATP